jgi:hypothetical protein
MTTAGPFGPAVMPTKHRATALPTPQGVGAALNIGERAARAWVNRIPHREGFEI